MHAAAVIVRSIRIQYYGCAEVGLRKLGPVLMYPVCGWDIAYEPMLITCMVKDDIHDHLHVSLVQLVNQPNIIVIASKAAVDGIVIRDSIAVIAFIGLIVFHDRVEPEGCNTHILQVVKLLSDSQKIPSVAEENFVAGNPRLLHGPDLVIRVVSIGEAIGHDEVNAVTGLYPARLKGRTTTRK